MSQKKLNKSNYSQVWAEAPAAKATSTRAIQIFIMKLITIKIKKRVSLGAFLSVRPHRSKMGVKNGVWAHKASFFRCVLVKPVWRKTQRASARTNSQVRSEKRRARAATKRPCCCVQVIIDYIPVDCCRPTDREMILSTFIRQVFSRRHPNLHINEGEEGWLVETPFFR